MKIKSFKIPLIILIWLGLILPAIPLNRVSANEIKTAPEFLLQPSLPGGVEKVGTYFEIKDSEYLNVSLRSTQEIKVILESIPRMISLDISSSTDSTTTNLTLSGLESNKTYYKYQDSYKNEAVFVSDENGSYSWTQDLTQPHHIWFQEIKGTIYIPDNCSAPYGIWDAITSTCTLAQDLTESVEITISNVTLDCKNHIIKKTGGTHGIFFLGKRRCDN